MTKLLSLEIITPERIAYNDGEINLVNVPSTDGEIGILPNHTPLFAKLAEGEVKVEKDKEEFFLAIGGGFIEVFNNKVTILVTRAVHAQELNEKEVLEAQKRAAELLKQKPTGSAFLEAQSLYRRALVDMKVLRRKSRLSSSQTPFSR